MLQKAALTNREEEILKLIVDELTSVEIAEVLDISVRTVETHRKNISHKADARTPIALVKFAIIAGYVDGFFYRTPKNNLKKHQ